MTLIALVEKNTIIARKKKTIKTVKNSIDQIADVDVNADVEDVGNQKSCKLNCNFFHKTHSIK